MSSRAPGGSLAVEAPKQAKSDEILISSRLEVSTLSLAWCLQLLVC